MSEEMKTIDAVNTEDNIPDNLTSEATVTETVVSVEETAATENIKDTETVKDMEDVKEGKVEKTEEKKKSSNGFFSRFKKESWETTRDGWILTHLQTEDIMEYLRMEDEREKLYLQAKETRNKRIMIAFITTVCLIAGVMLVDLLKDNPTILITILYIGGLLGFFRLWKKSGDK